MTVPPTPRLPDLADRADDRPRDLTPGGGRRPDRAGDRRRLGRGAVAVAAAAVTSAFAAAFTAAFASRPAVARVLALDAGAGAAIEADRAAAVDAGPAAAAGRVDQPPALAPTPALTEGPFYPPAFTPEPVRRLYRGSTPTFGTAMRLAGRVVDVRGRPLADARIEIWQCDARGHYHHPRDRGADHRDPDFEGFGWQSVGRDGAYDFATIVPVPYPGRTPHVHVRIRQGGRIALTSQIFLPEETAANGRDFLWRSLSPADRPRVSGTDPANAPALAAAAELARRLAPDRGADRLLLCDLVVSDV